uniref:Uncharacterized protein n=1 Tax=Zea mays TaxID=4577 RepID=B6SPL3_MAIZE|nr:hypothetical protein [Zea mays]
MSYVWRHRGLSSFIVMSCVQQRRCSSMVLVDELRFISFSPSVRLTYARRTRSPLDPMSLELVTSTSLESSLDSCPRQSSR